MNFTHKLWAKINTVVLPKDLEAKDKGAGFVEYASIIVLIGGIAFLIFGLGLDELISQAIMNAVTQALNP